MPKRTMTSERQRYIMLDLSFWIQCFIILLLKIEAEAVAYNGLCREDLLQKNGAFRSPNRTKLKQIFIHENTSSNFSCTWRIFPQLGTIKLYFPQLNFGTRKVANECDAFVSLSIIDRSALSDQPLETQVCESETPFAYFSKGPSLEVLLKGQLLHPHYDNFSFSAVYTTVDRVTTASNNCDPCGGIINTESGMIRSPRYPKDYPNNCNCRWSMYVRKGYIIKFKFWAFSLEPKEDLLCHDYVAIYDGTSASATQLGRFCGNRNPGSLRTTKNYAFVYFHSDYSKSSTGFEVMYESSRSEEDLTSLRSIAAILGGVSFGIFIFLLLCSIVYKRYISSDDRRNTCPPPGAENDYLDAVQAAAPPSYQTVMADPEHYPRTPEVTPSASPNVTPSLLRRNMPRPSPLTHRTGHTLDSLEEVDNNGVETPPPPYPGNVQDLFNNDDLLIEDLPPPPTYEMVSDTDDHDDALQTWAPIASQTDTIVGGSVERCQVGSELQGDSSTPVISAATSTATQVTSCDDDRNSFNSGDDATHRRRERRHQRENSDQMCLQCIENLDVAEELRRGLLEGDLRGSYSLLRTSPVDATSPRCNHEVSFNRRKSPSRCGRRGQSSDDREVHERKKKSRFGNESERSFSVPSLEQRGEHPDRNAASASVVRRSPSGSRSFFSRRTHPHNHNRVQPNNSDSENGRPLSRESRNQTDGSRSRSAILYIGDELSRSSHI